MKISAMIMFPTSFLEHYTKSGLIIIIIILVVMVLFSKRCLVMMTSLDLLWILWPVSMVPAVLYTSCGQHTGNQQWPPAGAPRHLLYVIDSPNNQRTTDRQPGRRLMLINRGLAWKKI